MRNNNTRPSDMTVHLVDLLKSGLWGHAPSGSLDWTLADWDKIARLSASQGVVGHVYDGILRLPKEVRPPFPILAQLSVMVDRIEQQNDHALKVASQVQAYLRDGGLDNIVLKGVGMARNYPNPRHRIVGDIDLLIDTDEEAFQKGRRLFQKISSIETDLNIPNRHAAYSVMRMPVELHGAIVCDINSVAAREATRWAREWLDRPSVRWDSPAGRIDLPPVQFDALYVFVHFFRHFIGSSCGIRQLCDWMMLLNRHADKIDSDQLASDIRRLRIWRPWQIFASVAVCCLGIPAERMPVYDHSGDRWALRTLHTLIFANENFVDLMKKKAENTHSRSQMWRSFAHLLPTYLNNFRIFPRETTYALTRYVISRLQGK